jgi:uncharacterized protein GlcG (DUF336 family)
MRSLLCLLVLTVPVFAEEPVQPQRIPPMVEEMMKHQHDVMRRMLQAAEAQERGQLPDAPIFRRERVDNLPLDLALDLAKAALNACRDLKYSVSVTVAGTTFDSRVVLRDDGATPRSVLMNDKKLSLVFESGERSSQALERLHRKFREMGTNGMSAADMRDLPGAVPIRVRGKLIGGLAVSGSPTAARDEACASAGIQGVGGLDG